MRRGMREKVHSMFTVHGPNTVEVYWSGKSNSDILSLSPQAAKLPPLHTSNQTIDNVG